MVTTTPTDSKAVRFNYIRDPAEIYRRSFAAVRKAADLSGLAPEMEDVGLRLIHASGMPKIVRELAFSDGAADVGRAALAAGARIQNDTRVLTLVIDEKGVSLGRYTKTWRAGEHWYEAGEGPVVFRIAGVDATVIICHDLRYPELARLGVAAGAQIVFIANNESGLTSEQKLLGYRSMQISRSR